MLELFGLYLFKAKKIHAYTLNAYYLDFDSLNYLYFVVVPTYVVFVIHVVVVIVVPSVVIAFALVIIVVVSSVIVGFVLAIVVAIVLVVVDDNFLCSFFFEFAIYLHL